MPPLDKPPSKSLRLPQGIPQQTRGAVRRVVVSQAAAVPCSPEVGGTAQRGRVNAVPHVQFARRASPYRAC